MTAGAQAVVWLWRYCNVRRMRCRAGNSASRRPKDDLFGAYTHGVERGLVDGGCGLVKQLAADGQRSGLAGPFSPLMALQRGGTHEGV